jgi:hypothetical protein
VLQLRELPGPHRRGADVSDFAGLDDVVQGFHGLLDRRVGVEAVDLVEVDVVGAKTSQGSIQLLKDRLPRQTGAAGTLVHLVVDLGGQHNLFPPGVLLHGTADELLGAAAAVAVGGVPEGDASSTAWRKNGCAASSSKVHWWKPGVPKLMQPIPIRLILSPVFPGRAYSITSFL